MRIIMLRELYFVKIKLFVFSFSKVVGSVEDAVSMLCHSPEISKIMVTSGAISTRYVECGDVFSTVSTISLSGKYILIKSLAVDGNCPFCAKEMDVANISSSMNVNLFISKSVSVYDNFGFILTLQTYNFF